MFKWASPKKQPRPKMPLGCMTRMSRFIINKGTTKEITSSVAANQEVDETIEDTYNGYETI